MQSLNTKKSFQTGGTPDMKQYIGSTSATITQLLTACGICVTLGLAVGGVVYTAYSESQEAQDKQVIKVEANTKNNTTNINDVKLDINSIQKDIGFIQQNIQDSKDIQQKILEKLDKDEHDPYVH